MIRKGGQPFRAKILPAPNPRPIAQTGAIKSVQEADISIPRATLDRIWTADNLELMARAYWAFLRRFTLGMIRVIYAPDSRTITAFGKIPLLRFDKPSYVLGDTDAEVRWPIHDGLLVAREGRGRGHLSVDVRRLDSDADPTTIRVRVTVGNFYPGIRGRGHFARFGSWLYGQTQVRVHVIVCNAYLRSLARLRLPALDHSGLPSDPDLEDRPTPAAGSTAT